MNPMFAEIRNDYMYGPAVEPGVSYPGNTELFAGVTIDGWETGDDDEQGTVIAEVIMTVRGDTVIAWHNNGARLYEPVLHAIDEAKKALKDVWAKTHTNQKYVYLKDDQGDMDLLHVHNYDGKFIETLSKAYVQWQETQSENHNEIYSALLRAGYIFNIIPCDVIIPGEY